MLPLAFASASSSSAALIASANPLVGRITKLIAAGGIAPPHHSLPPKYVCAFALCVMISLLHAMKKRV